MRPFGPIGSCQTAIADPSNIFYFDLSDRLGATETISECLVTTATTGITISDYDANIDEIENGDDTIEIGQAVQFRATFTVEQEVDAMIICSYDTNLDNADVIQTPLIVVKKVQ